LLLGFRVLSKDFNASLGSHMYKKVPSKVYSATKRA
jgi:hypothetical protein